MADDFQSQSAGGDSISKFANEQLYAKLNYGQGGAVDLDGSRVSERLLRHFKAKGTIRCANGLEYLSTNSAGAVDRFGRQLEGRYVSDFGELTDWTLRLAVKPTAKSSAASLASYTFRSFFINVSNGGRDDSLPQRLVAECIQVFFELLVDFLSIRVVPGEEAEDSLRRGFMEALRKAHTGIFNMRTSGISKELINKIDDYFDVAVDGIAEAIKKGQIRGLPPGADDALPALAKEFGAALARELAAATPERKKEFLDDPVAVFDFYNELLTKKGMSFRLTDEATEGLRKQRDELIKLREENKTLRDATSAGEKNKDLKETREEAKQKSNTLAV